ncbi:hypothetical protein HUO13_33645 [Saccharopolyspora erythraea]|uniref:hypothetical protein n=1 Tax=Saccharopolyspora erythraea TaxID=1836 RepID=UPI001BA4921A|nr:hypothetical protein [Saccharopolyspora erythraea]QUH05065.1 hypothetical protein HUO13_33645 [Saccharopolyspora erythraea]
MDRLSTGRRRDRDGSIPVSELIRREPDRTSLGRASHDATGRSANARTAGAARRTVLGSKTRTTQDDERARHEKRADELLAHSDDARAGHPPPLAARLVFGVLGVALVLGSAAMSSMIISRPAPVPTARPEPVDGVLALRPDLVRDARWPFTSPAPEAASPRSGDPVTPLTSAPPMPPPAVNPAAGSDRSAVLLVDELYRRLDSDPASAVELLAPELVDGQGAELAASWRDASSVRARPVSARAGTVVAEVELGYQGGDRVVLRHQFTVEPGVRQRISGAELVTARHFDAG